MRFEEMRYGLIKPVIATFYHWFDPNADRHGGLPVQDVLTLHGVKAIEGRPFYVCDDPWSWASPWVTGMRLYAVDCLIKKPFPLFEQFSPIELMADHEHIKFDLGGFDSVIYTPHPYGRGTREMALLYPKKQVIGLREIPPVSYATLLNLETNPPNVKQANWDYISGKRGQYSVPPWEDLPADTEFDPRVKPFHEFMEKLISALKNSKDDDEEEVGVDPEVMRLQRRKNKQKKMTTDDQRMQYDLRVQFVKTFGENLRQQQERAAEACETFLGEDEVIANMKVVGYDWPLGQVIKWMYRDPAICAALDEDGMTLDPEMPFGEDSQMIIYQTARRWNISAPDEQVVQVEEVKPVAPSNGVERLIEEAKRERIAVISRTSDAFKRQQAARAAQLGLTLEDDQIIVGEWIYTWENSLEDILHAMENDEEAYDAMVKDYYDGPAAAAILAQRGAMNEQSK